MSLERICIDHSLARNVEEKATYSFDMAQYRKYDSQHAHNVVASAQCWQELNIGPPRVLAVALLCFSASHLRIWCFRFTSGVSAQRLMYPRCLVRVAWRALLCSAVCSRRVWARGAVDVCLVYRRVIPAPIRVWGIRGATSIQRTLP